MSKKKTKEIEPFKFTGKSIIALIFVAIAGIMSGIFVGGFFIGGPQIDYSMYKEADLRDKDIAKLSQKAEGQLPTAFKSYELFEIAEYRMFMHGSVYIKGTGKVETIANQDVLSIKAYEDGKFFKESISKGLKSVGERAYYEDGKNSIEYYNANKINDDLSAEYGPKKSRTTDEFAEINGVPMNSFIPYIVSKLTLAQGFKDGGVKEITLENGEKGYEFKLELDPILSVLNYVKQMKNMSQLAGYPVFSEVCLECIVDSSYRFVSINSTEKYSVNYMGINANCVGTLKEIFEYGKAKIIAETVSK